MSLYINQKLSENACLFCSSLSTGPMAVQIQGHAHISSGGHVVLELQTLSGHAGGRGGSFATQLTQPALQNGTLAPTAEDFMEEIQNGDLLVHASRAPMRLAVLRQQMRNIRSKEFGNANSELWTADSSSTLISWLGAAKRPRVVPAPDAAPPAATGATAALQPPDDELLVQLAEKDLCIANLMVQAAEKDRIIRDLTRDFCELTNDNDTLRDTVNALRAQVHDLEEATPTISDDDSAA